MFQNIFEADFNVLLYKFVLVFLGHQQAYFELDQALTFMFISLYFLSINILHVLTKKNDIIPMLKPKKGSGIFWIMQNVKVEVK